MQDSRSTRYFLAFPLKDIRIALCSHNSKCTNPFQRVSGSAACIYDMMKFSLQASRIGLSNFWLWCNEKNWSISFLHYVIHVFISVKQFFLQNAQNALTHNTYGWHADNMKQLAQLAHVILTNLSNIFGLRILLKNTGLLELIQYLQPFSL